MPKAMVSSMWFAAVVAFAAFFMVFVAYGPLVAVAEDGDFACTCPPGTVPTRGGLFCLNVATGNEFYCPNKEIIT